MTGIGSLFGIHMTGRRFSDYREFWQACVADERAKRRADHVEPGGDQRHGGERRLGQLSWWNGDHPQGDQRPRCRLVGRMLERGEQARDLHVHDHRQRIGDRERSVTIHERSTTKARSARPASFKLLCRESCSFSGPPLFLQLFQERGFSPLDVLTAAGRIKERVRLRPGLLACRRERTPRTFKNPSNPSNR